MSLGRPALARWTFNQSRASIGPDRPVLRLRVPRNTTGRLDASEVQPTFAEALDYFEYRYEEGFISHTPAWRVMCEGEVVAMGLMRTKVGRPTSPKSEKTR